MISALLTLTIALACLRSAAAWSNGTAHQWSNTGHGSIIFEEAFIVDYPIFNWSIYATATNGFQTLDDLLWHLRDIHSERLRLMNQYGIDFMILSLSSPGIQGIADEQIAQQTATQVNNDLASMISNNTMRFGGFAALSMHNASQAAAELRRCVTELGFFGALINDFQQSGSNGTTLLYYDQPEYDMFWATAQELDVPIYLHPRNPTAAQVALDFAHSWPWLSSAVQAFTTGCSTHLLGICANGVFDRFPDLKLIVGHLGERIVTDLWRIDHHLKRQITRGLPMNQTIHHYFTHNIYETTSGNFWTSLYDFHRNEIGADRMLYSVDYPFMAIEDGAEWVDSLSLTLSEESVLDLVRNNAIKLFKLDG